VLVGDHVANNFYVYAICITCENLVQLKLNNRYFDQSYFHHVLNNFSLNGTLFGTKSCVLDNAQIDSTSWSYRSFSQTL
jgi:cyclophilin family peptidyl-prolyl cis-trans isomerase